MRTIRGNKRAMSLQNPPDRDETPIAIPTENVIVMIDEFGEILRLNAELHDVGLTPMPCGLSNERGTARFGYYPGLIAFAAAVLGGIGSIRGAFLGGVVLGFTQVFMKNYVDPQYEFSFAFGVMILTILVRPWGILGQKEAKRA